MVQFSTISINIFRYALYRQLDHFLSLLFAFRVNKWPRNILSMLQTMFPFSTSSSSIPTHSVSTTQPILEILVQPWTKKTGVRSGRRASHYRCKRMRAVNSLAPVVAPSARLSVSFKKNISLSCTHLYILLYRPLSYFSFFTDVLERDISRVIRGYILSEVRLNSRRTSAKISINRYVNKE